MYIYVCMYMYACICMHVYMYACVYVCMYMYACIYVCMYICMHVYMYACICLHVYMYKYVAVNLPCACPDRKPYCILFIRKGSELNNFNIAYILLILQLFCWLPHSVKYYICICIYMHAYRLYVCILGECMHVWIYLGKSQPTLELLNNSYDLYTVVY